MGDKLLFNFGAKLQNSYGNFPYALVPKWSQGFKMSWMKMSGHFGKPKHKKEHSAWCSRYDKQWKTHGGVP